MMLNNYTDDPWVGQMGWDGRVVFDQSFVEIPARSGVILPLNWKITDQHTLLWSTAEVRDIQITSQSVTLRFASAGYVKIRTVSAHQTVTRRRKIPASLTLTL